MACEPIRDKKKIQEMKAVLAQGQNGFRNRVMFELGLATALRIGDIFSIKKKDIQDGCLRIKTQKTGAYKLIALNAKVFQLLVLYMEDLQDDDLLFAIGRIMAWKIIKETAAKVGLVNISTHSLRKTAAWHFYHESGRDLAKTMKLLGHKDPKETLTYLQLADDEVNAQLVQMYL